MKIIKKENIGIHPVYNTNVKDVHNYIGNSVINHNCIVDFEYQGEIHLSLINTSNESVEITAGMKIIQFLEMPVFNSNITVEEGISVDEFYTVETTRGASGFGSTT